MDTNKIDAAIAVLSGLSLPEIKTALAHAVDGMDESQIETLAQFIWGLV